MVLKVQNREIINYNRKIYNRKKNKPNYSSKLKKFCNRKMVY